jgi:polysaccharide export outer membrane protein
MRNITLFTLLLASCGLTMMGQFISPVPAASTSTEDQAHVDTALLQSLLNAPYPEVLLRAGDSINVKVYGVKEYDVARRVDGEGTVDLPLIGEVPAAGSTVETLERSIAAKLVATGMVNDAQVSVNTTSQPSAVVNVSGDVAKPGLFPSLGQLTLIDYISLASGLNSPNFQGSPIVTLVRPSLPAPVTIPIGPDPKLSPYARIPIFSGDEIRVGKAGVVYAVGAFRAQGSYPLKTTSPTTVMQLVAMAGGIGYEADYGDAHIVRDSDHGRVLVAVNAGKILKGKAADVPLQANDILFLPTNLMKAALKGGAAGIVAAFATAYIYKY